MLENKFKTDLCRELQDSFEGCLIFHLNPNEYQGIPDLLILYEDKWAVLEGKKSSNSSKRKNQEYYVDKMNSMSFARFISPENKEDVINDLHKAFEC